MRAVIMAGGRGERLRPLTDTCPKPLLPVAGRPVLDRLLEKLSEAGIQDVTLAVGYLGSMIEDFVGDGARWGVRADYVRQVEPMGTAGALSLLADKSQPVLVVNGDKVFERARNFVRLIHYFRGDRPVVGTQTYAVPGGAVVNQRLVEGHAIECNAGVYVLHWPLLQAAKSKQDMPELLEPWCVDSLKLHGYVLDIGTPATYEAANQRLLGAATAEHSR